MIAKISKGLKITPSTEGIEDVFSEARTIKPKKLMSHKEAEQAGERDFDGQEIPRKEP